MTPEFPEQQYPLAPRLSDAHEQDSIEESYRFISDLLGNPNPEEDKTEVTLPYQQRHVTDLVRVKTYLPVALRKNDEFLAWRKKAMTNHYLLLCQGNMHQPTEKGMEEFVESAGNDLYGYGGCPGHQYFMKHILPVASNLAQSADQLNTIFNDALDVVTVLLTAQFSYTTHQTSRQLMEEFFSDAPVEQASWHSALGQFKHFYTYGKEDWEDAPETEEQREQAEQARENRKWLTMAIAQHQSWESDRHYDGLDFTNNYRKIEEIFLPLYKELPHHLRAKAFRAFVNYGGHTSAHAYLQSAQKAVTLFKEMKAEALLDYYFDMAEAAPEIWISGLVKSDGTYGDSESTTFPITIPETALEECRGIHHLPEAHRSQMIAFAKKLAAKDYEAKRKFRPTFIVTNDETDRYTGLRGTTIDMNELLRSFEAMGYTEDQIAQIFSMPERYSFLPKETVITIIKDFERIEQNFPGGIPALLDYLTEIQAAQDCTLALVESLATNECKLPKQNALQYYQLGKTVVQELGDSAKPYFTSTAYGNYPFFELADTDFPAFEKIIMDGIAHAKGCPKIPQLNNDREYFFKYYIDNYNDPNFDNLLSMLVQLRWALGEEDIENLDPAIARRRAFRGHEIEEGIDITITRLKQLFPANNNLTPADYNAIGRFLATTFFVAEDNIRAELADFFELVEGGTDYRIAALVKSNRSATRRAFNGSNFNDIPALEVRKGVNLEPPIPMEKATAVVLLISNIRHAITNLYVTCTSKEGQQYWVNSSDEQAKSLELEQFRNTDQQLDNLHTLEAELTAFEQDPEVSQYVNFDDIRQQINSAIAQAAFKRMLTLSVGSSHDSTMELPQSPFMQATNPATKMILTATALLGSIGVIPMPAACKVTAKRLPFETKNLRLSTDMLDSIMTEYKDDLVAGMQNLLPHLERGIQEARMEIPTIFPIGGKVHTELPMQPRGIQFLAETFGIDSTSFVLQHADTSLCLPPQLTSFEEKMLIKVLEALGMINPYMPDLQLTMAGQWGEKIASNIGAAMLLGTHRGVIYQPGAFKSKEHDSATGAHIMAYDAGRVNTKLPTHPHFTKGRTDIFGRHHYKDADLYQVMGALGGSLRYGQGFIDTAREFNQHLYSIFERRNVAEIIGKAHWIYDTTQGQDLAKHEAMVNALGEVWMQHSRVNGFGIIRDINQLVLWAKKEMRNKSLQDLQSNPDLKEAILSY